MIERKRSKQELRRSVISRAMFGICFFVAAHPVSAFVFVAPSSVHLNGRTITNQRWKELFFSTESLDDEECSIFNLDACSEEEVAELGRRPNLQRGNDIIASEMDFSQYLRDMLTQPVVEVVLVGLVLLSCFIVSLGTLQNLPPMLSEMCQLGEVLVSVFFTLEYFVRWYLKGFSPSYVVRPLAIIDLIAILPGIMQVVSLLGIGVPANLLSGVLVNLRMLRVLRLQRVLKDYETFCKFEQAVGLDPSDIRPYQLELARVVISIFTLLSVTAGVVYSAEHLVNPDIPDYFTSLYFAVTTISTVGFGDISPVTTAGRFAVSGSILVAVAVVPAQAAALADALLNKPSGAKGQREEDTQQLKEAGGLPGLSLEKLDARMNELEKRLDETNAKLDKILDKLE